MKQFLLSCFAIIAVSQSFGQVNTIGEFNRYVAENWKGEYQRVGPFRVKGTPYLLGESFPGKIIFEDGTVSTKDKILYDVYTQLAGPDKDGSIFKTDKAINEFVLNLPQKFGGESLLFKNSKLYLDKSGDYYLNVITEGDHVDFLKVFKAKLIPDPSNMYDKEARVYDQDINFYLFIRGKENRLVKMKASKKSYSKELSSIPGAEKIIASMETDFSKESDISKLIFEINQLK